jgi:uncharacterized lipoprotein NlpE involved in copper resistance
MRELLAMMETVTFESCPAFLREIELVKSELKARGSEYTMVAKMTLGNSNL